MQPFKTMAPPEFAVPPKWNTTACAEFVDLPVGRKCCNYCLFCYSSSGKDGSFYSLESLVRQLASERRRGVRRVHFVGGEPTIHPQILEILKVSKRLGFESVVVTNGVRFSSPDFCHKTFPFIDEIIFSLHGHDAETHGHLTGNTHSFGLMVKALENASGKGKPRLCVNTTVTNRNLHSLLPITRLIRPLGVRKYHCLVIVPLGRGKAEFLDLSPRLNECAAVFPQVAKECWEMGVQFLVSGLPLCILGPYYLCSLDNGGEYVNDRTRSGEVIFEKEPGDPNNFKIDLNRIKVPKCRECAVEHLCSGIYGQYHARYGDAELNPFRRPG